MSKIKPLARKADIVVQEFANEILIYDLKANKAFNLNETSAIIWQLSDGDQTISEIADNLTQKLNSPISEEFVWLALEQLGKEKLVENNTQISRLYEGVSRREIIKRVGLATVVALPIVSSLVAPTAIHAQSTCAPGTCRCGNPTPDAGSCNGSVGPGIYTNCLVASGNPNCNSRGPFNANGSGGGPNGAPGFKTSTIGCSL